MYLDHPPAPLGFQHIPYPIFKLLLYSSLSPVWAVEMHLGVAPSLRETGSVELWLCIT